MIERRRRDCRHSECPRTRIPKTTESRRRDSRHYGHTLSYSREPQPSKPSMHISSKEYSLFIHRCQAYHINLNLTCHSTSRSLQLALSSHTPPTLPKPSHNEAALQGSAAPLRPRHDQTTTCPPPHYHNQRQTREGYVPAYSSPRDQPPRSSKRRTTSTCPYKDVACNGIIRATLAAAASAPCSSSSFATSVRPAHAAP